uniref:Cyclin-dependent kinase 2-associated protein 1 n=1 Tax=Steinernema glaseri TaxID=37863 RepID=A0A1I7YQP0_9BILA
MSSSGTSTPQLPKNPSSSNQNASLPQYSLPGPQVQGSKYNQLLAVIEELGKDIRPTYAGNKLCAERLKRNLIHARILTKECVVEADKAAQSGKQ